MGLTLAGACGITRRTDQIARKQAMTQQIPTPATAEDPTAQGKAAAVRGEPLIENPFKEDTPEFAQWSAGWWSVRENDGDEDPLDQA